MERPAGGGKKYGALGCGVGEMEGAGSVNFAEPRVFLRLQARQPQPREFARDDTAPLPENTSDRPTHRPSEA